MEERDIVEIQSSSLRAILSRIITKKVRKNLDDSSFNFHLKELVATRNQKELNVEVSFRASIDSNELPRLLQKFDIL